MTISYPDNTNNRAAISASGLTDSTSLFDVVVGGSERKLTLAELKKTGVQVINVKQYGAVGDGVTDDTAAIQAAIDEYSSGARYFSFSPGKTYLISSRINLDDMHGFVIDLNGATIQCSSSSAVDASGKCLNITGCTSFEIRNGTIDGNRASRGAPAQVPAHNIAVYNCSDFVFYRITSKNAVVDGFYFDEETQGDPETSNYRGTILSCVASGNARQGMSIISGHDIRVYASSFVDTYGLSPQAGIDIEADPSNSNPGNTNMSLNVTVFSGNSGNAIQMSSVAGSRDVIVTGCLFEGKVYEKTVTFNDGADTINCVAHGFLDGQGVTFRTTGTIASGVSLGSYYYVVNATADTFQISTTYNGSPVNITSTGSGTHTAGRCGETIRAEMPCVISACDFRNILTGRGVIDTGAVTAGNVLVVGCKFYNCATNYRFGTCVYQHGSSLGRLVVSSNYAESCASLCSTAGDYCIVSNNIVNGSTKQWGGLVTFESGSLGGKAIGNTCFGLYLNGVLVESSSTNHQFSIIGNTFINTTSVSGNPSYGTIRVLSDNGLIQGNVIHLDTAVTNATGVYLSSSASVCDANRVTGYSTTAPIVLASGKASSVGRSNFPAIVTTWASGDTTPSCLGASTCITANSSATTLTAIDDGVVGQAVNVIINDANTTIDFTGTTLKGNGGVDWTPASGDHMVCTFDGTNWYCIVSEN